MPNKIKPKRSYTSNSVPLTTDLEAHELAINWADGVAYTKDASGQIVTVPLGGGGGGGGGSFSGTVTIPASGDEEFSSVSLLMHMDGSGSSFTDSSSSPKTVTVVGNVTQSATQSKFGGKSAYFPGDGNYLYLPDDDQFDLPGDFVIEAWVYLTAYSQSWAGAYGACVVANYKGGIVGENPGWQLRINGSSSAFDTINVYTGTTDLNWTGASISLNTWTHVAVSRSGSSIRAYVAGSQVGSAITNTDTFTEGSSTDRPLWIGQLNEATYRFALPGYIDDLRITKGTARGYTGSTIVVPSAAFGEAYTAAQTLPVTVTGSGGSSSGLSWSSAPASATATGTAGQIAYDGEYFYVATGTNTWKRTALATWAGFTPASVTGLQLWLDASDASSLYDATTGGSLVAADGAVARWEDKSGNARHFTQSSSGSRPLRKTSQQNGKDTLLFARGGGPTFGDDILIGSDFGDYFQSGQSATVFVVLKTLTSSVRHELINKQNASGGWRFLLESDNKATLFFDDNSSNRTTVATTSTVSTSSYSVLAFKASGGSLSSAAIYKNGASLAVSASGSVTTVADNSEVLEIGGATSSGSVFDSLDGNIAEIIIYDSALSGTDREAVENYLLAKWAII
jgi:hypothetical protein